MATCSYDRLPAPEWSNRTRVCAALTAISHKALHHSPAENQTLVIQVNLISCTCTLCLRLYLRRLPKNSLKHLKVHLSNSYSVEVYATYP